MHGPQQSSCTEFCVPGGQLGIISLHPTGPTPQFTAANSQTPKRHATFTPLRPSASQVDCKQLPSHGVTTASNGFESHSQQLSTSMQSLSSTHSAIAGIAPVDVPLPSAAVLVGGVVPVSLASAVVLVGALSPSVPGAPAVGSTSVFGGPQAARKVSALHSRRQGVIIGRSCLVKVGFSHKTRGDPFKPCMQISRTRLTSGLSGRCSTVPHRRPITEEVVSPAVLSEERVSANYPDGTFTWWNGAA